VENGRLLTPNIDHYVWPPVHWLRRFRQPDDFSRRSSPVFPGTRIETQQVVNVGSFTDGQRAFLDFHRNGVLLRAKCQVKSKPAFHLGTHSEASIVRSRLALDVH